MKRIIIATLAALAINAQAADVTIDIGSVIIKEASVPKVQEFLATKAQYRIVSIPVVVSATNELGEVEVVSSTTRKVREEVPEGDGARLKRLILQGGWYPLKAEFKEWSRQQAIALIAPEPDPEE